MAFPPGPGRFEAVRGFLPRGADLGSMAAFLEALPGRYGPTSSWAIARRRFFFITEPALIEELLVTKAQAFVKGRGIQRLERLLGRGLLTSNGAFHLRQRRLVQPAFHRERVAAYAQTMIDRAEAFAATLVPGATVEISAAMDRLTLGIAAATLFGADLDDEAEGIGDALDVAMESFPIALSPIGELLDHLPFVPVVRRFRRAKAHLDGVILRLIAERLRAPGDDALSLLLAAADGDDQMTEAQVLDEAKTLLLAGFETTANALAWTWLLLARHPAVSERLAAELADVLADRAPAPDDLPRLRYARDVVAEALRLYPPAWILGRRAIEPVALGPWSLPRGAVVLASPLVTQRDRRWWRDPEAFRPERWSNGEAAALPKFAYYPFGGGNRVCIGEAFAWTEATLALASIARRWRFRPAADDPVRTAPFVTLRPAGPIRLVAEPLRLERADAAESRNGVRTETPARVDDERTRGGRDDTDHAAPGLR